MIALLRDEPAAERVASVVESGSIASWINVGEIYYQEARRVGDDNARLAIDSLERKIVAEEPDAALVMQAANLKARKPISYADGFAVATAQRHGLPLYTGDPEIIALSDEVEVVDLRKTA